MAGPCNVLASALGAPPSQACSQFANAAIEARSLDTRALPAIVFSLPKRIA
jgi:hypothetical protein